MTKPDFFVVGAPKCGTSSLHTYLAAHPEVFMSRDKEPTFFGKDIGRSWIPYPTLEDYLALFREARDDQRAGESSVAYLRSKRAPEEIRRFNPESQIIVMLRNPVDVMYSFHGHMLFIGEEKIVDFRKALAAGELRRAQASEPDGNGQPVPPSLLYREIVRFAEQLERWLTVFGRERLHVIVYDDFAQDVAREYERVLCFLGVDPDVRPGFTTVNAARRPRSKTFHRLLLDPPARARTIVRALVPERTRVRVVATLRDLNGRDAKRAPMPHDLRRSLVEELGPEVGRLSQIIDRDLSHWLRV